MITACIHNAYILQIGRDWPGYATLRIILQAGLSRVLYFVLGFWDKNTVMCAGAIPYRRYFPATTRILTFKALKGTILPAILFLAWDWNVTKHADERARVNCVPEHISA